MSTEDEIVGLLQSGGIPSVQAEAIGGFLDAWEADGESTEFQALVRHRKPGQDAVITSIHPRNIVFNLGKFVAAASVVGGGLMGAAALSPLVLIGAGLAVLPSLADVGTVDLGEDHSKVVMCLWFDFEGDPEVLVGDLAKRCHGIDELRLDGLLRDLAQLGVIERRGLDTVLKRERIFMLASASA